MALHNESTSTAAPTSGNSTISTTDSESVGYLALDGCAAGIAAYLLLGQIISCFRNYGCYFGKLKAKKKAEEILLLLAPIVALTAVALRITLTLATLYIPSSSQVLDNILRTCIIILYYVFLILTYSVLWLRQRVIYLKPTLFHLSNPLTRVLSKYLIIYIIVTGVTTFTVVSVSQFMDTCFEDCFVVVLFSFVLIAWPLSCQLPLLFLMFYPLYKHQTSHHVTHQRYVRLMVRIATLTTICLISDVTTVVVSINIEIYFTPQQVNMIVNLACVTLTPRNWIEKLLPCVVSVKKQSRYNAPGSSRDGNLRLGGGVLNCDGRRK